MAETIAVRQRVRGLLPRGKGLRMEIGSIYELNPETLPKGEKAEKTGVRLTEIEKYRKSNVEYTMSGRAAIALALRSIVKNRPGISKRCLLPAYMCDTVFFPFEWEGWEIHFYHIKKNLEADEGELRRLVGQVRPGLLFIHAYYGVDTWKPMRSLLKEWKNHGICIMEDVTQSYYLEGAGEEADYVVGSLRKWYPLPDGGFVASKEPLAEEMAVSEKEFTEKRIGLLTEKWSYLYGKNGEKEKKAMKESYLKKNREMEEWLDNHRGIGALSVESAGILAAVDEAGCRIKRSGNYYYLSERMKGKKQFWPILPEKEAVKGKELGRTGGEELKKGEDGAGTAPLYLAVYALDRNRLQRFLTEHNIYAPVLWPVGKENEGCLTEDEKYIFGHMLALPMDQRYGRKEMEHMADILDKAEKVLGGMECSR